MAEASTSPLAVYVVIVSLFCKLVLFLLYCQCCYSIDHAAKADMIEAILFYCKQAASLISHRRTQRTTMLYSHVFWVARAGAAVAYDAALVFVSNTQCASPRGLCFDTLPEVMLVIVMLVSTV